MNAGTTGRRGHCFAALVRLMMASVSLALAAAAQADPPSRVGRLSWLAGDVTLRDSADGAPAAAQHNWPLTSGNVLATGPSGRAEVWVGSTALRLDVDSELQVSQLDDQQLRLQLRRGTLALRVATPDAARSSSVDTSLGRISALEPGEFRIDDRGGPLGASAWKGSLYLEAAGSTLTVRSGQRAELSVGSSGAVQPQWVASASDDFEAFVRNRDAAFDGRAATRYVSPEMTGIEDLDSHGRWMQSADYGSVWVPAVDPAWAPYRYGRWAWVEPWGWTWVDDAAWGFAPFHYGRWALWQGQWAWVPGSYVARPVYAPALVGWAGGPPGVSVGVSLNIGTAPVGWFPLAPHEVYMPPYTVSANYVRNINVTHVTNITNVTNLVAPPRYTFQGNPQAATVVNGAVLTQHQPVARHLVPVSDPRAHALLGAPAMRVEAPPHEPPQVLAPTRPAPAGTPVPPVHYPAHMAAPGPNEHRGPPLPAHRLEPLPHVPGAVLPRRPQRGDPDPREERHERGEAR